MKIITYDRKRVMKVPINDHDGQLYAMMKEYKTLANESHRFYRSRLKVIATCTNKERTTKLRLQISRLIARYIRERAVLCSRTNMNYSGMNTIDHPIKEFLNRKKNRKRPPRFRKMGLRIKFSGIRVHLEAASPAVEIAFMRSDKRKGSEFHTYRMLGSKRYIDRFEGEPSGAYMTFKNGRVWLSIIFSKTVECRPPKSILGLDAGMYSNKSAWIGQKLSASGEADHPVIRIDADSSPIDAAKQLVAIAKEHKAGIAIEKLKSLNRSRSGDRFGIATSKYSQALVKECENHAIPLYEVDAKNTSRLHHKCRTPLERPKDERGWDFAICHHCNEEMSADENAAMNIAIRGWDAARKE